jgi:hypothetical protein
MNFLEQFMPTVKETFLSFREAENYLKLDSFHKFIKDQTEKLYKHTIDQYGHMIYNAKYHRNHGSKDITNPYGLYDVNFNKGGADVDAKIDL